MGKDCRGGKRPPVKWSEPEMKSDWQGHGCKGEGKGDDQVNVTAFMSSDRLYASGGLHPWFPMLSNLQGLVYHLSVTK